MHSIHISLRRVTKSDLFMVLFLVVVFSVAALELGVVGGGMRGEPWPWTWEFNSMT